MAVENQPAEFGSTVDACCGVTADLRIVVWNTAAEILLGRRAADVVGRDCFETLDFRQRSGETICRRDCLPIRQAREGRVVPILHATARTPGGESRPIDVATVVVPDARPTEPYLVHYVWPASGPADTPPLPSVPTRQRRGGRRRSVLTPTEQRVLALLAEGASTAAIAATMRIAHNTARNYIQHVIDKLGAHSRLEAVARARRWRLLSPSADR